MKNVIAKNIKKRLYSLLMLLLVVCSALTVTFANPITVSAASTALSKTKGTYYLGQKYSIKLNNYKKGKSINWSSSNTSVATVSGSKNKCTITAKKAGTAYIYAKHNGKTYTYKATVKNPTINSTKTTLNYGKTFTLYTKYMPANATWTVDNSSIVSITKVSKNKYTVKGLKAGTTYVNASFNGITKRCKVTVKENGKLNKTKASIYTDGNFSVKLSGVSGEATWSVSSKSDLKLEKVSKNSYKVYGLKEGSSYVYAKYNGKTYKCKVTVKDNATLSHTSKSIYNGKSFTLKLTGVSSNAVWSTKNNRVKISKTESNTYKVTGLSKGSTYVYAKYKGKTYKCKVTVKDKPVLNVTSKTVAYGDSFEISMSGVSSSASWSISDKTVVKGTKLSTNKYKLTAVNAGTSTINAKYDGKTYTCAVTVTANPSISSKTLSIGYNGSDVLKLNGAGDKVSWSSSNNSVVTVSGNGNSCYVKAVTPGTATVSAVYNGSTYKCLVTVKTLDISGLGSQSINLKVGNTAEVVLGKYSGYASGWKSTANGIASVNQKGVVTGLSKGTCKVQVTIGGNLYEVQVTVTVDPVVTPTPIPNVKDSLLYGENASYTVNWSYLHNSCFISGGGLIMGRIITDAPLNVFSAYSNNSNVDVSVVESYMPNGTRYVGIKMIGMRAGTSVVNVADWKGIRKSINVTVTSDYTEFFEYNKWRTSIESNIWNDSMDTLTRIRTFAQYLCDHYEYVLGQYSAFSFHSSGGGDCCAHATIMSDVCKDLGLTAYNISGTAIAPSHIVCYFVYNGQGYIVDASTSGTPIFGEYDR